MLNRQNLKEPKDKNKCCGDPPHRRKDVQKITGGVENMWAISFEKKQKNYNRIVVFEALQYSALY